MGVVGEVLNGKSFPTSPSSTRTWKEVCNSKLPNLDFPTSPFNSIPTLFAKMKNGLRSLKNCIKCTNPKADRCMTVKY